MFMAMPRGIPEIPLVIGLFVAMFLAYVCVRTVKKIKRKRRGETCIRAYVESIMTENAPMHAGKSKKQLAANTLVISPKYEVVFRNIETDEELHFMVKMKNGEVWKKNDEGTLHYSGDRLIRFEKVD